MASAHSETRPYFHQTGSGGPLPTLGRLYNARSEQVLVQSILNTTAVPAACFQSIDHPKLNYRNTSTHSLKEKFVNLNITAEFGLSAVCGMLGAGWGMNYLSDSGTKIRAQQASVICVRSTKSDTLQLENNQLSPFLDLSALHTQGATHVICGIEWGARTLVTMKTDMVDAESSCQARGKLGTGPLKGQANRNIQTSPRQKLEGKQAPCGILASFARAVAQMQVDGDLNIDSGSKDSSIAIHFEIETDVPNITNGGIPTSIEDIPTLFQRIPEALERINDGKGVPIAFHILPIHQVCEKFNMQIRYDTIVQKIDQGELEHAIRILEGLQSTTQDLHSCLSLFRDHSFCVQKAHIAKIKNMHKAAEWRDTAFKRELMKAIVSVRSGEQPKAISEILNVYARSSDSEEDHQTVDSHHSLVEGYRSKMFFADTARTAGAEYISHEALNDFMLSNRQCSDSVCVYHFNGAAPRSEGWNDDQKTLFQLLDSQFAPFDMRSVPPKVVIVDYDCPTPSEPDLPRAYIEERRGVDTIITSDLTRLRKEVENLCLVKCGNLSKVDRSRGYTWSFDRRIVRIPCPGKDCFRMGRRRWVCPTCRAPIQYGFSDTYLSCDCSRYLYTDAVFRCNDAIHGAEFVAYNDMDDLHQKLEALDINEEYNILILGKSGVGKSMLINSLDHYTRFPSLNEAMDPKNPFRWQIPCSFTYEDTRQKEHCIEVGKATIWERFGNIGSSSTNGSTAYCFHGDDGAVVRFIDTPGILDTNGLDADRKNAKTILRMLESINRLSAILILLPPNETRLDVSFKFCIMELLSRLHCDMSKNILFGITNAAATNFTMGATGGVLDEMLKRLDTGIIRSEANQFFFDSKCFMFLAVHKLKKNDMAGGQDYHSGLWSRSASEARRLVETVKGLPTHDVAKTISLNRTSSFLEAMAKPLASFTTSATTARKHLDEVMQKLADAEQEGGDLAKKAIETNITIEVPVKHDLPENEKRTVCCHESCVDQRRDEKGVVHTVYKTICHRNCDLDVADEVPGAEGLKWCNPFRKFLIFPACSDLCNKTGCKHHWKSHMHISYEFKNEKRTISDSGIQTKIKSNEDMQQALKDKMETAKAYQDTICREQEKIQHARALFFVYISSSAVGTIMSWSDATVQYLNLKILTAQRDGRTDEADELTRQRDEHMAEIAAIQSKINDGTIAVPDEKTVSDAIENLRKMPVFGKNLGDAVGIGDDDDDLDAPRHVNVNSRTLWKLWVRN